MNILAIETATPWCGIALIQNGQCFFKIEEQIPRKHAEQLPMFYQSLRAKMNLDKILLDGIAVSIGPGSFTGLRVGLGFVKGLAFAKDLPIIPVPTLQIMAANGRLKDGAYTVLMYSHRDIVYLQEFSDLKPVGPEKVDTWDSIDHSGAGIHCGCEKLMKGESYKAVHPSAEIAGLLAEKHFTDWVIENPYDLVPNYISPFELGPKK